MSEETVDANISVQEYFEQKLPQMFAQFVLEKPPTDLEDQEFRVNFDVDGTIYGAIVRNGSQLEIVPGGAENSHMSNQISESDWRDTVTGKVIVPSPLFAYNTRKQLDKLKNIKGLFKLRLSHDDGAIFHSATTFNGVATPEATLVTKVSDYANLVSGKLKAPMAMMTGKVKIEGSLPFIMLLGTLNQ